MIGIANFDSAGFFLNANANFLHNRSKSLLLNIPTPLAKLFCNFLISLNTLPKKIRAKVAHSTGLNEAIEVEDLINVNEEKIAEYIVSKYPNKKYPAIAIGSSNGALSYLYSALKIPWLPQTNLILVKRELEKDNFVKDLEMGKEFIQKLSKNKNLTFYQMNDPINDRFMAQKMAYFRIKYTNLPKAYQKFIKENLSSDGVILSIECQKKWPSVKVSKNHFYQIGGLGGTLESEYINGSPRVTQFLNRNGGKSIVNNLPKNIKHQIEAEWGFDERLIKDIKRFSKINKLLLKRIIFTEPEEISPAISKLFKYWYKRNNIRFDNLYISQFMLIDPLLLLQKKFVPFWTVFNGRPSLETIDKYLKKESFKKVYLSLFSNLVESVDVPIASEWIRNINRHSKTHLVGVNKDKFPFDISTALRYYFDLKSLKSTSSESNPQMSVQYALSFLNKFIRY